MHRLFHNPLALSEEVDKTPTRLNMTMLTPDRLYMVGQLIHSHSGGLVETVEEETWDMMVVILMGTAIWAGDLVEVLAVVVDPVEVLVVVKDLVEVLVGLVDLGGMEDMVALGGQDADLGAGLEQEVATTGEPEMLPAPNSP